MATTIVDASYVAVGPVRHRISVDDFHRMAEVGILRVEERAELLDGEVFDMSPIGRLHAALVASLSAAFHEAFGRRLVVWTQNPIRLDAMSEVQPDIVLLDARADFYGDQSPGPADVRLLVEVADTSLTHDLGVKVPLYARHGIREVWVVEATTRRTHHFRAPSLGQYAEYRIVLPEEPLQFADCRLTMQTQLPTVG